MEKRPLFILASSSPRRKQLLEKSGASFFVAASSYEEHNDFPRPPEELVRLQAEGKAMDVWKSSEGRYPVLGADTIVCCDGAVLGKPADEADAARMLHALSGRTHRVMTGIALIAEGKSFSDVCVTEIMFRTLSEEDIRTYIASGEPMGKAGAYAIQGKAGEFAENIDGSWSNVVGLPLGKTRELFRAAGVSCK